jgi:prepilin-type N-terminal cleavage/methylation domain-containing protein
LRNKKASVRYSIEKRQQGFTLVELLIAMALALVIIGALSSTFIIQRKTYDVQGQIAEMTQNARAAVDMMTREIRLTGYGTPGSATSNLSSWITWVSGITFSSGPLVIQNGSGALGSDIVHVAACFDGIAGSLNAAVSPGPSSTSISLKSGEGSKFNATNKKVICIGDIEHAVIKSVSGDTLTIDTDPGTSGNQGLKKKHEASESVSIVKVISYGIVQETEGSKTVYTLKRNENLGAGRQPLAQNIVDLQITLTGKTIEINRLRARIDKPDPNYTQNNGYRTYDQRAYITPPNLLIK